MRRTQAHIRPWHTREMLLRARQYRNEPLGGLGRQDSGFVTAKSRRLPCVLTASAEMKQYDQS
jgi:hypothetical protein